VKCLTSKRCGLFNSQPLSPKIFPRSEEHHINWSIAMKRNLKFFALTATAAVSLLSVLAIDGNFVAQIMPGQTAQAGIFDGFLPSGIYVNIGGHKYYFGDYAEAGDDAVVFKDGSWEVKINGRVSAHGYGRTPGWVIKAITTFFGPIPVS
jgi:hypothetical protein